MPPTQARWTLNVPRRRVDEDGTARVIVELLDGTVRHEITLEITDRHEVQILVDSPDGTPPLQITSAWSTR